ncbi:DMT family transporter [Pseudoroseomonas cervicalis]|uniref:DMT family transporter n=1 Tax=Teichococcus cervicalis TaxID=204525 RepID=UPI0027874B47|nr:DMT family transporter [Pseudoroseomonas cervicalis]MDQ1077891.1 drug/metabolite transporter (DMT)-like permease [Pseudoroseomonas cervicalis]
MQNALLFLVTVLIWGSTWIAIAWQVGSVPVLVSVFYRFGSAALILLLVLAALRRLPVPGWRDQPYILAQALCLFSCNFLCFYSAAAYLPSGLISVIFSLATLYNAVNARIFFGDRIAGRTLLAAALGVSGLLLLFGRDALIHLDGGTLSGAGLAALGTLFFSLGNMASRRNSAAGISPLTANAWGMAYGALLLLALIGLSGTPHAAPPDGRYLAALLYLSLVGSVVGFTTYLMLVSRIGSSRAAYTTVLFPVVALSLSTLFEGYRWDAAGLLGLALTLLGNVVIFWRAPAPRPAAQPLR